MPLDGLTLNVLVNELQPALKNSRVLKIYQPEDATITLHLRLPGETKILLMSADAMHPRMHTLENQPENPLNPPPFCMLLRKYLEPSRLIKIQQLGFDRVVHLHFECLDELGKLTELVLIFELMGRQSNIYLVNQAGEILDAIKRFPENGVAPGKPYLAPSDQGKNDPTTISSEEMFNEIRLLPASQVIWKWIADFFQGFSKVGAQEVVKRAGFAQNLTRGELDSTDWTKIYEAFSSLMAEIQQGGTPAHYPDARGDFAGYKLTDKKGDLFPTVDRLVGDVLNTRQSQRQLESLQSSLRRQLTRHLKRASKKATIHKHALKEAEQADVYRHQGELLTASFHLIPSGKNSVEVPDYTQEGTPLVTIELDPRLSPSNNVKRIFKRYTKAKARLKHARSQLKIAQAELDYLETILLQIELADESSILREIELELERTGYLKSKKKRRSAKKSEPLGPKRYLSRDGLTILVGRNNRQNDELTFRLTKPNHLWLHARGIAGSHVAILEEGEIPETTLLQAAELAAYFSEQQSSSKVAVDYTQRKHVRKIKGAQPGFVRYDHAKTIFVNPSEISLPVQKK